VLCHNRCSFFIFVVFRCIIGHKEVCLCVFSIEVTPEQHARLKAVAALHGQSIKDYVLERMLPLPPETEPLSEEDALRQLEEFLRPRVEAARRGEFVSKSVEQIFREDTIGPNKHG
jgi:Antitoxin ParD